MLRYNLAESFFSFLWVFCLVTSLDYYLLRMLKLFFSYPLRLEIEKNEFTKKDKLINEELENWKHKFTNESMAHKNTNDEEKMARDEIKKVQVELQQKNYEIQQKNEKLEEMGNEKIKRSKYIEEKEKQLNYLKMQISELQSELDTKNEEMNDLRNRYTYIYIQSKLPMWSPVLSSHLY